MPTHSVQVKFWDPRQGKELHTLHAHKMTINKVRWNMNGNWLLSTSRDQITKLFDLRTLKEIRAYRGHKREVQSCKVVCVMRSACCLCNSVLCGLVWRS